MIQLASYDTDILGGRANSTDKGGSEEGAEATAAEPGAAASHRQQQKQQSKPARLSISRSLLPRFTSIHIPFPATHSPLPSRARGPLLTAALSYLSTGCPPICCPSERNLRHRHFSSRVALTERENVRLAKYFFFFCLSISPVLTPSPLSKVLNHPIPTTPTTHYSQPPQGRKERQKEKGKRGNKKEKKKNFLLHLSIF